MSRTHRVLAMLALSLALVAATTALAAAATPPDGVQEQRARLLRDRNAAQAERTQATVALARSMDRNLKPVAATGVAAAQPARQHDTTAPAAGSHALASLLLGLVAGLVGGAAAIGGWIVATRRRRSRPIAAT